MKGGAAIAAGEQDTPGLDSSLMMKVFYAFAALALLSATISLTGRWLGKSVALAGHTDEQKTYEVVIGNNVISAPANTIRFERARRDGTASRLDLYLRWPDLSGYSESLSADFNHVDGSRRIIFLSFQERIMSRDMSGRFEPIYASMIVRPGTPGPGGTVLYEFIEQSGYVDEALAVAEETGPQRFVARCLSDGTAEDSLAPCERDIDVGDGLSLTYRFPRELLGSWRELDAAIERKAGQLLGGSSPA